MSNALRIAINGYGRIGRCVLRALLESPHHQNMQVVAINEPADLDAMVHLTRFDSTHGPFPGTVEALPNAMVINGHRIAVTHEPEPARVPWHDIAPDLLFECSGHYATRQALERFIAAGCPKVLVSHPTHSAEDVDHTVVYGINEQGLSRDQRIVSAASCTTNASVPVLDVLDRHLGVRSAMLSTLHSVMNDQPMIDGYHHSDLHRTRSAMQSIIPVATGLAAGVERLLPHLAGRIQAKAIRVPIHNVSAIDLVVHLEQPTTVQALNALFEESARMHPDLFACTRQPHASVDFIHDSHSVIIDQGQTSVNQGHFANMLLWFDNEWGFAHRMLDVASAWARVFKAGHP
ncbi:type I glyceraldehyde-3-phosphate dehydrogenase [Castellaniella sp.]|uniref:type I glyceraldehyde-3-phosphate dehydrogenase n=1 Tax=Castellaniella sp. TaxID=1955812 RepID=UPI003565EC06